MSFRLEKKRYRWWHFFVIPFQCDAGGTIWLGVQKILTAISAVVQVPVIAKFVDTAIEAAQGRATHIDVLPWFSLLILCAGWRRISYNVGRIFSTRITIRAVPQMSLAFTDKRAKLEYSHIENQKTWDLVKRVCDKPDARVSNMVQRAYNLIVYAIRIGGLLTVLFMQVWWVGVLTALLCIPLVVFSMQTGKKTYTTLKEAAEHDRYHEYYAELITGREAVDERALFGFAKRVDNLWYKHFEASRKINTKAEFHRMKSVRTGSIITTLLAACIGLTLVYPVANGVITVGMFIALTTGMYDLVQMMGVELTRALSQLAESAEYLGDLSTFAALEETSAALDKPQQNAIPFERLEFKDVSFVYPETEAVILKNLSFVIENGKHYAFVGANGAGKSTIIKLLCGLYDNYTGEILLNQRNICTYTTAERKAFVAGVYQDFARYYISASENVLLGNINELHSSEAASKIEKVLAEMDLLEDLQALPQGLNTPLGKILPDSIDLSGGQWQRLAMARALISAAPLMVLDEPTSALDPLSECHLYERFEQVSRGRTTVFISHRLGSTSLANHIFVLDNGTITEQGSHKTLVEQNGLYAEMYDSQRSWYQ